MSKNVLAELPSRGICFAKIFNPLPQKEKTGIVMMTRSDFELMEQGATMQIMTNSNEFVDIKVGNAEGAKLLHFVKIYEMYADDVLNGRKTFEVRKNDRDYREGDKIIFTVVDNMGENEVPHALTGIVYEITYVIEDVLGLQEGYAVLGIRRDDPVEDAAAPNDR